MYASKIIVGTMRISVPQILIVILNNCYGYEVIIVPTDYYSSTEIGNSENKDKY